MKKIFLILISVIGFGIGVNAQSVPNWAIGNWSIATIASDGTAVKASAEIRKIQITSNSITVDDKAYSSKRTYSFIKNSDNGLMFGNEAENDIYYIKQDKDRPHLIRVRYTRGAGAHFYIKN
jgi:hypothetical protein